MAVTKAPSLGFHLCHSKVQERRFLVLPILTVLPRHSQDCGHRFVETEKLSCGCRMVAQRKAAENTAAWTLAWGSLPAHAPGRKSMWPEVHSQQEIENGAPQKSPR